VFPFQWRIAVSWISGYLMFQLFTPLVFVNLGEVAAGRLGMSLAIFAALQSVGVSWINAKIPVLTTHIARGEHGALNRIFRQVLSRSAGFTTVACLVVLAAVHCLGALGWGHLANRVADLPTLACIAVTAAVNTVVYGAASYMRAHRVEPMLTVSVVAAGLTLTAAYFASRHGMFPTMLLQAMITVFVCLPWTLFLFRNFHHGDGKPAP